MESSEANSDELYPSLLLRVQSILIDSLVIITAMILFATISGNIEGFPDGLRIVFFILILLYEPICISLGSTLGNKIVKIRVRKYSDGTKRINIFQAIVKYMVKLLLGWISFFSVRMNPERRAIHDLVSGSVMLKG